MEHIPGTNEDSPKSLRRVLQSQFERREPLILNLSQCGTCMSFRQSGKVSPHLTIQICCFNYKLVSGLGQKSLLFLITEKHGDNVSYLSSIAIFTSKFGSSYSTRISEAVARRSIVDHPPGPVRLPDYKCRFLGPLRLKFSPRWPGVKYIIAARENNPEEFNITHLRALNALQNRQRPLSVGPLRSQPSNRGRSRSEDFKETSRSDGQAGARVP